MNQKRATYSIPEAAQILGISRSSLYEAVKRNEIPGVIRIGQRTVISRAVLDRLVETGESAPPTPMAQPEDTIDLAALGWVDE